jgi:hypothetical protein
VCLLRQAGYSCRQAEDALNLVRKTIEAFKSRRQDVIDSMDAELR